MNFDRSHYVGAANATREQVNEITTFLDASMVYGSDAARAEELRTLSNGEMKTSANGFLLPNNVNGLPNAGGTSTSSFLAGK